MKTPSGTSCSALAILASSSAVQTFIVTHVEHSMFWMCHISKFRTPYLNVSRMFLNHLQSFGPHINHYQPIPSNWDMQNCVLVCVLVCVSGHTKLVNREPSSVFLRLSAKRSLGASSVRSSGTVAGCVILSSVLVSDPFVVGMRGTATGCVFQPHPQE